MKIFRNLQGKFYHRRHDNVFHPKMRDKQGW